MIEHRPSHARGQGAHGWLQSRHSFSFADYHDAAQMGWGNLRVINEDQVAPGAGFGTHSHRDMEIISLVLDGALAHRDSMGHVQTLERGEVQRMSAGTGVSHSEFNASATQPVHFLQIWILPDRLGLAPSYEQRRFDRAARRGRLQLVAAPAAGERVDALSLNADARLYLGDFDVGEQDTLGLASDRLAYVHVIAGALRVNGLRLTGGDALKARGEARIVLDEAADAQVLVFDLAP